MVIRNSGGEVMASLSEKIVKPQTAELVEILAANSCCAILQRNGFLQVSF